MRITGQTGGIQSPAAAITVVQHTEYTGRPTSYLDALRVDAALSYVVRLGTSAVDGV